MKLEFNCQVEAATGYPRNPTLKIDGQEEPFRYDADGSLSEHVRGGQKFLKLGIHATYSRRSYTLLLALAFDQIEGPQQGLRIEEIRSLEGWRYLATEDSCRSKLGDWCKGSSLVADCSEPLSPESKRTRIVGYRLKPEIQVEVILRSSSGDFLDRRATPSPADVRAAPDRKTSGAPSDQSGEDRLSTGTVVSGAEDVAIRLLEGWAVLQSWLGYPPRPPAASSQGVAGRGQTTTRAGAGGKASSPLSDRLLRNEPSYVHRTEEEQQQLEDAHRNLSRAYEARKDARLGPSAQGSNTAPPAGLQTAFVLVSNGVSKLPIAAEALRQEEDLLDAAAKRITTFCGTSTAGLNDDLALAGLVLEAAGEIALLYRYTRDLREELRFWEAVMSWQRRLGPTDGFCYWMRTRVHEAFIAGCAYNCEPAMVEEYLTGGWEEDFRQELSRCEALFGGSPTGTEMRYKMTMLAYAAAREPPDTALIRRYTPDVDKLVRESPPDSDLSLTFRWLVFRAACEPDSEAREELIAPENMAFAQGRDYDVFYQYILRELRQQPAASWKQIFSSYARGKIGRDGARGSGTPSSRPPQLRAVPGGSGR